MSTNTKLSWFAGFALSLLCSCVFAAEGSQDWTTALEPLKAMPVQESGFIRSATAFAEDHLLAIAHTRSWDGRGAIDVIFQMMADPIAARQAPLLKIEHPDLVQVYHAKRISLATYRDPAAQEKLMALYRSRMSEMARPINDLEGSALHLEELENELAIVPRSHEWLSPAALAEGAKDRSTADAADLEIVARWKDLKKALAANDPAAGRPAAEALAAAVLADAQAKSVQLPALRTDVLYHQLQPFAKSAFLSVLAVLGFGGALLVNRRWLGWAGFVALAAAFLLQVFGLSMRWILSGRAPLSNMYESFTFAVTGLTLVALVFEVVYRTRLAGLGGAILSFIFMVLAHKAPIFDSQIRPLMPALQSSWLTYHVVTIMLSYSAFALSFFVSVVYLAKDAVGGDASRYGLARRLPALGALDVFNYKIIAVGFPLLTLGIVFGAVWAATAWGRPWGFDPKETWSAITWLIYAIYLHTRFLAGWKGRRAAILALLGFAAVLFTYLGVNYLLPGLHSYV